MNLCSIQLRELAHSHVNMLSSSKVRQGPRSRLQISSDLPDYVTSKLLIKLDALAADLCSNKGVASALVDKLNNLLVVSGRTEQHFS